jgi:hypothetical protein
MDKFYEIFQSNLENHPDQNINNSQNRNRKIKNTNLLHETAKVRIKIMPGPINQGGEYHLCNRNRYYNYIIHINIILKYLDKLKFIHKKSRGRGAPRFPGKYGRDFQPQPESG